MKLHLKRYQIGAIHPSIAYIRGDFGLEIIHILILQHSTTIHQNEIPVYQVWKRSKTKTASIGVRRLQEMATQDL